MSSRAHVFRSWGGLRTAVSVTVLVGICGCWPGVSREQRELMNTAEAQKKQIEELQQKNIELQKTIDEQKATIANLRGIPREKLALLVVPTRIEIDRLSGGYDEDGRPGDDGVVAHVRPLDERGDVIKTAGKLVMEVFDLAAPADRNLVLRAELDAENALKQWYGRLWTNHFSIKAPWPPPGTPPAHRELTLRVQFTPLLTGETLSAQRVVQITLPPGVAAR